MASTNSSSSSSTLSSTTTSSLGASSSATTQFAPIQISHAVTIRLAKDNYLLWKAQFLPYLGSTGLIGYVDGTFVQSSPLVATSINAGATQVANPLYITWYNQDQLVPSGILASLTEEVLAD